MSLRMMSDQAFFESMTIPQLKQYILEHNGSIENIIQKEELIEKALNLSKQNDDCFICQQPIVDEANFTCPAAHGCCFRCILEYIEKNKELKTCPICRGGLKFITLGPNYYTDNNITADIDPFYTIQNFKECLPILYKILNIKEESYLISEELILLYQKNKKQLQLIKNNIENFDMVNWSKLGPKIRSNTRTPANGYASSTQPVSGLRFVSNMSIPIEVSDDIQEIMRPMLSYFMDGHPL